MKTRDKIQEMTRNQEYVFHSRDQVAAMTMAVTVVATMNQKVQMRMGKEKEPELLTHRVYLAKMRMKMVIADKSR